MICTTKGKVVYKRKTHTFKPLDIINIMTKCGNNPPEWFLENIIACHNIFIVAKNTFETPWLNYCYRENQKQLSADGKLAVHMMKDRLYAPNFYLKEDIRNKTRANVDLVLDEVMDFIGGSVEWAAQQFVMSFYDTFFDAIWDYWDPYFGGSARIATPADKNGGN